MRNSLKNVSWWKKISLSLFFSFVFSIVGSFFVIELPPFERAPFLLFLGAFLSIAILIWRDIALKKKYKIFGGFGFFILLLISPFIPAWFLFFSQGLSLGFLKYVIACFSLYFPGACLFFYRAERLQEAFIECGSLFVLLLFMMPLEIMAGPVFFVLPAFSLIAIIVWFFLFRKSVQERTARLSSKTGG
jgi:hypothetical protein